MSVSEGWPGEGPQICELCVWPEGLVTRLVVHDLGRAYLIFLCHRFSVGPWVTCWISFSSVCLEVKTYASVQPACERLWSKPCSGHHDSLSYVRRQKEIRLLCCQQKYHGRTWSSRGLLKQRPALPCPAWRRVLCWGSCRSARSRERGNPF